MHKQKKHPRGTNFLNLLDTLTEIRSLPFVVSGCYWGMPFNLSFSNVSCCGRLADLMVERQTPDIRIWVRKAQFVHCPSHNEEILQTVGTCSCST